MSFSTFNFSPDFCEECSKMKMRRRGKKKAINKIEREIERGIDSTINV